MKHFFRENGILLLVIALLLTAILGVGSAIFGSNPLSNLLGIVTTPFRAGVDVAAGWVEDRYNYAFRYDELEEEPYSALTACPNCAPPRRVAEIEEINAAYRP